MLHFNLEKPVQMLWFGEFVSPEQGWRHLTRRLFEYEMMIVTEGELYIGDEEREYRVQAGEYLVMSPTRFQHGTRECKCRFYWMHFHCPALPAELSLPPHGSFANGQNIRTLAEMLLESEATAPRGVRSRYLATQILLELERGQDSVRVETPRSPRAALVENIKTYVTFHRFSEIRVGEIARELGYHEKYLSAIFHAEEGVTLKRYIMGRRLEEAKRLLLESDYSVAEIAYYLNFQSPHNFSRFFKQETGIPAGEFRTKKNET